MEQIPIQQLPKGGTGTVTELIGDAEEVARLTALGIRKGGLADPPAPRAVPSLQSGRLRPGALSSLRAHALFLALQGLERRAALLVDDSVLGNQQRVVEGVKATVDGG